jgi:hypothetical protein
MFSTMTLVTHSIDAADLVIRMCGNERHVLAAVHAETEPGQDLLDDAFDMLAECFERGDMLLRPEQIRALINRAAEATLIVAVDPRG